MTASGSPAMRFFPLFATAIAMAMAAAGSVAAPPAPPRAAGAESGAYVWNKAGGEKDRALRLKGDPDRGRTAYEVCQGCHRPDGSGRADGSYPQLAGQHASVLIKQMSDIRAGQRDNPKMFPFAGEHVISVQEIADIAAHLQRLGIPPDNGKGSGTALERGERLYRSDCKACHRANGEGDPKKFYPVLAGQHYSYLLRQSREIRDGNRRNANPRMIRVVRGYDDEDLAAVADYMSRRTLPERGKSGK